jgi:hypothetical protein
MTALKGDPGVLLLRSAPEFGMMEVDARFISLKPADLGDGWSGVAIDGWEVWSV